MRSHHLHANMGPVDGTASACLIDKTVVDPISFIHVRRCAGFQGAKSAPVGDGSRATMSLMYFETRGGSTKAPWSKDTPRVFVTSKLANQSARLASSSRFALASIMKCR